MKKFPKTLFVKGVDMGDGDSFFQGEESVEELPEALETMKFGEYELKTVGVVTTAFKVDKL